VFGNTMVVHEFVHDARHFLASPVTERSFPWSRHSCCAESASARSPGWSRSSSPGSSPSTDPGRIDYEGSRDEGGDAVARAAGQPVEAADPEIFSRAVQSGVGIGVGVILFGVGMGALFAVVYSAAWGRVGRMGARELSLLVALGGFVHAVPGAVPESTRRTRRPSATRTPSARQRAVPADWWSAPVLFALVACWWDGGCPGGWAAGTPPWPGWGCSRCWSGC